MSALIVAVLPAGRTVDAGKRGSLTCGDEEPVFLVVTPTHVDVIAGSRAQHPA